MPLGPRENLSPVRRLLAAFASQSLPIRTGKANPAVPVSVVLKHALVFHLAMTGMLRSSACVAGPRSEALVEGANEPGYRERIGW